MASIRVFQEDEGKCAYLTLTEGMMKMTEKPKSALVELEIALDNWKSQVQESLRAHKKGKYHPNPYWILKEIKGLEGKTQAIRQQLEELNSLLSKRPHSYIDEHWVGGAFHEYAKPVRPHEFELWFWEFEPKWRALLSEGSEEK